MREWKLRFHEKVEINWSDKEFFGDTSLQGIESYEIATYTCSALQLKSKIKMQLLYYEAYV